VLACGLLVGAATRVWTEVWPGANPLIVVAHLAILGLLAVGACFDDWLSILLRLYATVGLLVLGVASALHVPIIVHSLPACLAAWHPLLLTLASIAIAFLLRDRNCAAVAGVTLAVWAGTSSVDSYQQLRRLIAGLDQIAAGLVFLVIAAAISLKKAGLWRRPASKLFARLSQNPRGASRSP
jgi:hypothetical protein